MILGLNGSIDNERHSIIDLNCQVFVHYLILRRDDHFFDF
jgi:hypothetical protein